MIYDFFLDYNHFKALSLLFSKGTSIIILMVTFLPVVATIFLKFNRQIKNSKLKYLPILGLVFTVISVFLNQNGPLSEQYVPDYKNYVYFGSVENGKPMGYGRVYNLKRQICYVGEMKDGKMHGKGKLYGQKKENGSEITYLKYEGEFENNNCTGQGVSYIYSGGKLKKIYEGEFLNNKYNGEGVFYGWGIEDSKLKEKYEGGFVSGKRYGYGQLEKFDSDGNYLSRYRGSFIDDKKSGTGCYEFLEVGGEKLVYVGEFVLDKFSGHGVMYNVDGKINCQGKFENNTFINEEDLENEYLFPDDVIW